MVRYHDEEWGVPVHDDRKWFEFILLDAFQAGLSWKTVLHKRKAFRQFVHSPLQFRPASFQQRNATACLVKFPLS